MFLGQNRHSYVFKKSSFDELFIGRYLPLAVREERARFFKWLLDEQQQAEPTSTDIEEKTKSIPAPDIKNTSAYS